MTRATRAIVSRWLNARRRRMVSERDAICRKGKEVSALVAQSDCKDLADTGGFSFAVITNSHAKPLAPNRAAYN